MSRKITEQEAEALIEKLDLVGRGVPMAGAIMYWPRGVYENRSPSDLPPPPVLTKDVSGYGPVTWTVREGTGE